VAWRRGRLARIPASWLLLLVTTVLVVIPVTVRNYVASGEFVPIATYFGENLLIGNDPDADGVTPWLPYLQELEGTGNWTAQDYINVVKGVRKELGRPEMTHTEVSSYFAGRAKAFMKANPGLTLRRMLKKAVLIWSPVEITCNKVVQREMAFYPPLNLLPRFPLVAALFWAGLALVLSDALSGRLRRDTGGATAGQVLLLLLVFTGLYLASFIPFFVNGRARVPAIPLMLVVAGPVLARILDAVRSRETGRVLRATALPALLAVFFSVQWVPYQPDLARRGESEGVMRHYEAALRIAPQFGYVLHKIGKLLAEQGRQEEVEKRFQEALRLIPEFPIALNNLGTLALDEGKPDEALACFDKALTIHATDPAADLNRGRALLRLNRPEDALAAFASALEKRPGDPELCVEAANALVAAGRVDDAFAHYERPLAANPDHLGANFNLGTVLLALGQRDRAREYFEKVRLLNPDFPRLAEKLEAVRP